MNKSKGHLKASTVVKINNLVQSVGWPIVATILGLLLGAVIIILSGYDPLKVYAVMVDKSLLSSYYLFTTLTRAVPVIICAMAACICWRAGYINLGIQGQMTFGAMAAVLVALYCPGPKFLVMILAILAGGVVGALYAVIPTVLQWKGGLSMVVCTLMLNYVATDITTYMASFPFKSSTADVIVQQTDMIDEALRFPRLIQGQTVNISLFIALAVVIGIVFFCNNTVLGYESKMGGFNPHFARYGGTKQVRTMFITMCMAGAVAGLAGICECFGTKYCYTAGMFSSAGYAWTGLQAALIGQLNPVVATVYAILLTALDVGGSAIQRNFGVPSQLSDIIKCAITLFVSVRIVERIEAQKQPKGLSAKTVRNIHQIISSALKLAVEQRLIARNPADGCALPKAERKEMQTLPVEQLTSFLREAKDSGVFALYYIDLTTGLRRGELLGLKWSDIDLEKGDLRVQRQIGRIDGKIIEMPLKTKNAYRTLPLSADAIDVLMQQRRKTGNSEWVFPSPTGGPMSPDSVLHMLHRVLKRAGLPKVRFHDLRHTFATMALQNGVDIKTVSGMLGHFSAGFTLDTYAHVTTSAKREAAKTMGDILSGAV